MGSEPDPEPRSTPKLSLFSLPSQSTEPPGMLTPPLRPAASVPFQWEEEPGKPRTYTTTAIISKPSSARCLELPPRLLTDAKITNIPSPTTVLDGPYYVSRSVSYSASFSGERQRSFRSPEGGREQNKEKGYLSFVGSWRKRGLKGDRKVGEDNFVISSSPSAAAAVGCNGGGNTKVKITKFRRSGSFLRLSQTRSHLWASIYGAFKQVVPWNGRKTRKDGFAV